MTVRELIDLLKSLDQDRNIWLVYDRYSYQFIDIDVLGLEGVCKADSFKLPSYMEHGLDVSKFPKDGDYFIDAF